jgi:hypothetical protein
MSIIVKADVKLSGELQRVRMKRNEVGLTFGYMAYYYFKLLK